jgi:digeranylgeranylglycerophospholipid reductase
MKNCRVEDEDIMKFYFGNKVAPLGYLWVFPKGNGLANVGVGVRKGVAKDYLDRFIKGHPNMFANAETLNVSGAPVIVSGQLNNIAQDNIVLCGESAGQVIPLTGAGIHTALVSGRISGEVIVEALEENEYAETKLSEYANKFNTIYGERIRKSRKALMALEKLSDSDLNKLAELLTGTDVLDLANGTNIERVAKKFLHHPILAARVARALLS